MVFMVAVRTDRASHFMGGDWGLGGAVRENSSLPKTGTGGPTDNEGTLREPILGRQWGFRSLTNLYSWGGKLAAFNLEKSEGL